MADTITDDDSLISQDDIDNLLNAASLGGDDDDVDDDEPGELSQDDIDSLLNASTQEDEDAGDSGGELSQDDIDRMLSGGGDEPSGDGVGDEFELVSQDDIDALLNTSALDSSQDSDSGADEGGELSQDDIDRMLSGGGDVEPDETRTADGLDESQTADSLDEDLEDDEDLEMISQEDIARMLNGKNSVESPGDGGSADERAEEDAGDQPDEHVIDDSQALSIEDCLVKQETLDSLLSDEAMEPEPQQSSAPSGETDAVILDDVGEWTEEGEDISQADIDALLMGDDDKETGDGWEENDDEASLISQADIDALLQGSDEEDEDFLADGEEDTLAGFDEEDAGILTALDEDTDQVVLEEADNESDALEDEDVEGDEKPRRRWSLSRLVMACAAGILILGLAGSGGWYFFLRSPDVPPPPMQASVQDLPSEATDTGFQAADYVTRGPGTLTLDRFILMAPAGMKAGFGYITAGITIEYSDPVAEDEIRGHLARYRDIIYEAMGSALTSEKGDKITQDELLGRVKDALNGVLPGEAVTQVTFTDFLTG